ncbi:hypothetical protein EZJ49_06880 [Bdellovibrio bacteriovorus]|uniref:hypothetical protein n=1 Tax=Bdellovibrio bacteriovorus TaxID=959 RepID=UPI0021D133DF|nr:hypothetical protein [Bdellovibrio bacteriovorus]UXR65970.1 hypothetical protein EZJ49_06880 [Bdellovibrio bacteriovorus]
MSSSSYPVDELLALEVDSPVEDDEEEVDVELEEVDVTVETVSSPRVVAVEVAVETVAVEVDVGP